MISDEKLASLAVGPTPEQEKVVRNVVRPVISEGAAVSHALQFLQDVSDMAQELLRRRQSDRAIWENAPERANWFARDADGMGFYYSEEPERGLNGWFEGGEFWPMRDDGWQSALQERPK